VKKLKGKIDHLFHLAAIYDLKAGAEEQQIANVEGTKNTVKFADAVNAGCFHHVSSIAAAGLYEGTFREDMFEEAEELDHPYFRTKHDSEGIVRNECDVPWRVYRPAIVVGHSKTGEMDKIDGPYYFFPAMARLGSLPSWLPLAGPDLGDTNVGPVDFVAAAMDVLIHRDGLDGRAFHLMSPEPQSLLDVVNAFLHA